MKKNSIVNPHRRQEWREAQLSGACVTAVLLLFVAVLTWNAEAALIDGLSSRLNFRFSLSACAAAFSKVLLATTIFAVAAGFLALGLVAWGLAQAFTEKVPVGQFVKSSGATLVCAAFLLWPLISGDGIWHEGRRRARRLVLEDACLRSHTETFYRLDLFALTFVALAFFGLAYQLFANRAVREGWSPNPDPAEYQASAKQQAKERLKRSGSRLWFVAKWAVTIYAGLAFGLSIGAFKLTVLRTYKEFAWEKVDAPVLGSANICIIERDDRGKGRRWVEESRAKCSDETLIAIREDLAQRKSPPGWRVSVEKTYSVQFSSPDGQTVMREVGLPFVPNGTPVGSMVQVVRNPADPGNFDVGLNAHERERAAYRLKVMLISGLTLYLLHFHRWKRRTPGGSAGGQSAASPWGRQPASVPKSRLERYTR